MAKRSEKRSGAEITYLEREAISNLIAVICGDGGHYESKHGLLKAVEDAEHIVTMLRSKSIVK